MRRSFPPHRWWRVLVRAGSRWLGALWLLTAMLASGTAQAQGVELMAAQVTRGDGGVLLEYSGRLSLSHAIEDALQRGVPMYFQAQATLLRNRWYWRDERIARATRVWRLSYQPLTSSWRVSTGGLSQGFASLPEALAQVSRVSGWRLVDAERLEAGERYYVEFSLQLDNSQLPRPMQLDLGQDWKLGIERTLRVE